MNEEIKSEFSVVQAAIYIFTGAIVGILALGCLFSYPDPVWYLGLLFSFSSLLLFYSAFSTLKKKMQQDKENARTLSQMKEMTMNQKPFAEKSGISDSSPADGLPKTVILASWNYTSSEWAKFKGTEKKFRIQDSLLTGILIAGFGAYIIHSDKGESWTFSITFGVIFATIFVFLKFLISRQSTSVRGNLPVHVVISMDKIMIQGKLFSLSDQDRWLEKAEIKKGTGNEILEFTIGWKTRSGNTNDFILIPIPKGKKEEAERMIEEMRIVHRFS